MSDPAPTWSQLFPPFAALSKAFDLYNSPLANRADPSLTTPKHRDNVIHVVPRGTVVRTNGKPNTSISLTFSIDEAIKQAVDSADSGEARQFSIIVHQGIYNDDLRILRPKDPEGFSLDIIGLGGVYIHLSSHEIRVNDFHLSMTNLVIVDETPCVRSTIQVEAGGCVDLNRVFIRGIHAAVGVKGSDSRANLIDCAFLDCSDGFRGDSGAVINMTRCVIQETARAGYCGILENGASLKASKCKFIRGKSIRMETDKATADKGDHTTAQFYDCDFNGGWSWTDDENRMWSQPDDYTAITAYKKCKIEIHNCDFTDWNVAVLVQVDSHVTVTSSKFSEINATFAVCMSSYGEFRDNTLQCCAVLHMYDNGRAGSAVFQRNKMSQKGDRALMFQDKDSCRPSSLVHDFEKVEIHLGYFDLEGYHYTDFQFQHKLAELQEKEESGPEFQGMSMMEFQMARLSNELHSDGWRALHKKTCRGCGKIGSEELGFKKCSRCQEAFYCSKECQTQDWPNSHQKICRNLAKINRLAAWLKEKREGGNEGEEEEKDEVGEDDADSVVEVESIAEEEDHGTEEEDKDATDDGKSQTEEEQDTSGEGDDAVEVANKWQESVRDGERTDNEAEFSEGDDGAETANRTEHFDTVATARKNCRGCFRSTDRQANERFKKCAGCRIVYYCDKDCQKSDWQRHKQECTRQKSDKNTSCGNGRTQSTATEDMKQGKDVAEASKRCEGCSVEEEQSNTDGNSSAHVKKTKLMYCTGCQNVYYCSRTCQRADWANHKWLCTNI